MANPVEILPLLVVALLLIGAQGGDVESIDIRVDGSHTVSELDDVLIVGGGTTTVPAETRLNGSLYVIGGDARIAGRVDGTVVQLAGTLAVDDTARVTELRLYGGERSVAPGSTVESRQRVEETLSADPSPGREVGFLVVQALVLSLAGLFIARRRPTLLDNVADSVTNHAVVSGTVGLLASVTLVALFTFMAFTLVLLPVSLLGLLLGVLVVGYGYVVFGFIVGRRLPVDRPDLAVATGVVVVVAAVELLGRVPVVGALVQFVFLTTAIGAILITYFGLREFEPVDLPE